MSFVLVIRRYAPFATFGGGFEGDSRTKPSLNPTASARTIGIVSFDESRIEGFKGFSSGSMFDAMGPWVAKIIGRHYSNVTVQVSRERLNRGQVSFTVHTSGANPLVPMAPDIDTFLDFSATYTQISVRLKGRVRGDTFPNAEVILLDRDRRGIILFDYRTSGGRETGPLSLFGAHSDQILGRFAFDIPLKKGAFTSLNLACPITK